MTTRLPLAATAAALLGLALATPAAADAAPRTTRWWASFEGRQRIDWRWPKTYGTSDCYKRFWSQGTGDQRITIKTARPVRVVVYRHDARTPLVIKYGTWNPLGVGTNGLVATARTLRLAVLSSGVDAGRCGGSAEVFEQDRTDCGARAATVRVTFGFARGQLFPAVDGVQPTYTSCELRPPDRFKRWFEQPPARADAQALFGRRGISISRTMVDSDYDGSYRRVIREGQVTWTLRLTRAR